MFRNNSLPVSRYCIVESGKRKQSWAAVDRLSARGECVFTLEDSGCQSVSSETSYHGGARCSIEPEIDVV